MKCALKVAVADSILLDHHLAEDAAQETLAAACRQLGRLKDPARFGPWIAAICRNVARDMRRASQIGSDNGSGGVQRPARPDADGEPDDEQRAILAGALEKLPEHLREVLFLRVL